MNHRPQRLDVEFSILWKSRWHVGSGQGTAAVDRLLRRRGCGPLGQQLPFVPGSQIKGVLRHQCERLTALLCGEGKVVSPHVVKGKSPNTLLDHFRPLRRSGLLIDRLFGSRFQGDCLFVEDAVPTDADAPASALHGRTAIDRVSGTARDRSLFVTEVAPAAGAVLHGRLQARHPPEVLTQDDDGFPFEYALLLAGLLSLDALGGDKSTGLGKCQVEIAKNEVRWNNTPAFPLADALRSFGENPKDGDWSIMISILRDAQA